MDLIAAARDFRARTTGPVILEIDLARGITVAPPDNPLAALKALNSATMGAVREGLRQGATDPRVKGLIVHVAPSGLGLADLQNLGDMIAEFGGHKPTTAWTQTFGEMGNALPLVALATRARTVWVQPSGLVFLGGLHLSITLLRGLFEKVGLTPEFGQRKEYKSAAEQYAGTEISEANREMMQRLADSVVEQCLAQIAAGRGLEVEAVRAAMDESPVTVERAVELGLVDKVGYRDQVYDDVYAALGLDRHALQFVHRYDAKVQRRELKRQLVDRHAPQVGIVTLRGPIVTGRGAPGGPGGQQAGGDAVADHLRAAARDDKVKAVVLRIDSPGGSAVASDTIWREVHRVRESGRPVVALMGNVAASGGYYAAMGADEIVAAPSTLTGSIGVLAGKVVTLGLLDKLALKHEGINSGPKADLFAADHHFTAEDWAVLDAWLDAIYEQFTAKAAADRKLSREDLEKVAKGRVWTGADALERGLVDHLGNLELAVQRACALAEVDRDQAVLRTVPAFGMLEQFIPADSTESSGRPQVSVADGPEALLPKAIRALGLGGEWAQISGPLALPWRFDLR
ncbi:signal peptide peptidase SppA [Aestuariimicrobium kwangyangense]|uniref:signal peptide peptidase SppA n=1 Tax=Aestuariimicrobium kwangyangense TaxID=396389 RepID=UPI0003B4F5F9|nr:signal peptide peptidase SppA [Aestuariimicrobium kwangyangense]